MKRTAIALAASTLLVSTALSEPMSSANYRIPWDVMDGGGGTSSSASYQLTDSVGQPSAIGTSTSANYVLEGGFLAPPDTDADRVRDFMDNCTLDPNTGQLDTNADGYGNICDTDINNDGTTNFGDLAQFKAAFFPNPYDPDADFNGDGFVNFGDLALLKFYFLSEPGPSGIAP